MTLTRRDFNRLAATAAASTLLAYGHAQTTTAGAQKKTRYCIVGLGRISLDHFMPGTRQAQFQR